VPGYLRPAQAYDLLVAHGGAPPPSRKVFAVTAPLVSLPVGLARVSEDVCATVRDPRQHAAVAAIIADENFDHALMNPFTAEVGGYTGPFVFAYRTRNGDLHARRIGKSGRVLQHVRSWLDEDGNVHSATAH
jgi:hypothetical protein